MCLRFKCKSFSSEHTILDLSGVHTSFRFTSLCHKCPFAPFCFSEMSPSTPLFKLMLKLLTPLKSDVYSFALYQM